jgi:hypothetical protein
MLPERSEERAMPTAFRIAGFVGLWALAYAGFTNAQTNLTLTQEVSATGMCKAATYHAGLGLRYRPIGIYNTGDTAVDLSCSLRSERVDQYDLAVSFYNYNNTATTVTCALLAGSREGPRRSGQTKSVSVPAGSSARVSGLVSPWVDAHFISLSCRVPPRVEMGTISSEMFCYYGCQ